MVTILRLTFRAMWAFHTTKEQTRWANITVSSKSETMFALTDGTRSTRVIDRQFIAWFTKNTFCIYYLYERNYRASMILEISTEPLKGYYAEYSNYQTSSEEPVLDDHTSLFVHSTSMFYTQCTLKSRPVKVTFCHF